MKSKPIKKHNWFRKVTQSGKFVRVKKHRANIGPSQRKHKPKTRSEAPRPKSGFGCARGLIKLSPDFDEPLDDFAEYS